MAGAPEYGTPWAEVGGGANELSPGVLPIWCGGVYGIPWSAARAAARPVPSVPSSGGGGVFSRCLIGSGAAGAAGLYGNGAKLAESRLSSGEAWDPEWTDCWSAAIPLGGGGGKLMVCGGPCVVGAVTAVGSDRELRVCPFW